MPMGRFTKGLAGFVLVATGGLVLSGCMGSMNDLSRDPQFQPPAAAAVPFAPAPGAPTATVAATPAGQGEKKKLLTPDEQARIIAELEALAARQGAPMEANKTAQDEACTAAAAQALDPEERLRRERQGLKC